MSNYTKINISDVKDVAPDYGMAEYGEARSARGSLGADRIGISHYRVAPGKRLGFGHRHDEDEEIYVVLSGTGRFKVGDEVFDVGPQDMVYVPPRSLRGWQGGPDGMELIAFGGHGGETEMIQDWWTDD